MIHSRHDCHRLHLQNNVHPCSYLIILHAYHPCAWPHIYETAYQSSVTSPPRKPVCAPAKTPPHWGWLSASIPQELTAQGGMSLQLLPAGSYRLHARDTFVFEMSPQGTSSILQICSFTCMPTCCEFMCVSLHDSTRLQACSRLTPPVSVKSRWDEDPGDLHRLYFLGND